MGATVAMVTTRSRRPGLGLAGRLRDYAGLFRLYRRASARGGREFDGLAGEIGEYRTALAAVGGPALEDCRVLEVGFGARPWRLYWLAQICRSAEGIDLDRPIRRGTPGEALAIARRNGLERAAKSLARHWLFDRAALAALAGRVRAESGGFDPGRAVLTVQDAGDPAFWAARRGAYDLIVSEQVLEHVPRDGLERAVAGMADALAPGGLAFLRPMIFTGISGGHHLEWYPHAVPDRTRARLTEPWEHLRRNRHPANTWLNELTRADYRALFARRFEILEERVDDPELGRAWMTPELRSELAAWPDEELFSNAVAFVLRAKTQPPPPAA
jgi:SAM-dependent methyltransferase